MTRQARDQHAPAPRLTGTGRLADDLYLMAHHEATGRPLLQPRAAGLGLAGALLAELTLAGTIEIVAGGFAVTGPALPGEGLAGEVARQMAGEDQPHPARDWLAFLARTAAADVAGRQHYATLLGVPAGSPAAWALPASYAVAAVIGLGWGLVLKIWRPQTYTAVGLGAHAVTGQLTPAAQDPPL